MDSFTGNISVSNPSNSTFARDLPNSQHSKPPKSFGSVRDMVSAVENNGITVEQPLVPSSKRLLLESNVDGTVTKTIEIMSDMDSIQKSNVSITSSSYSNNPFLEVPKRVQTNCEFHPSDKTSLASGSSYSPINPHENGSNTLKKKSSTQASKVKFHIYDDSPLRNSCRSESVVKYIVPTAESKTTIPPFNEEISTGEILMNLKDAHKVEFKIGNNTNIKSSHIEVEAASNEASTDNISFDSENLNKYNSPVVDIEILEVEDSKTSPKCAAHEEIIQQSTGIEIFTRNCSEKADSGNVSKGTWDGEGLIKKFGYQSEVSSPDNSLFNDSNRFNPAVTGLLNLQETQGGTPFDFTNNKLPQNLRRPSIIGRKSRRSSYSNWRLGDIDGLEKTISNQSSRSRNSTLKDQKKNPFNEDSVDNHSISRKVSFCVPVTEITESHQEDKKKSNNEKKKDSYDNSPERDPESGISKSFSSLQRHNVWKIICISMAVGAFIFYVILLTYNFFFERYHYTHAPYGIKERDVFTFFAYAQNSTRHQVIQKLMKEYGMKPNIINETSLET